MKQQRTFINNNVYKYMLSIINDDDFIEVNLWHKLFGKLWAIFNYGIKENYE